MAHMYAARPHRSTSARVSQAERATIKFCVQRIHFQDSEVNFPEPPVRRGGQLPRNSFCKCDSTGFGSSFVCLGLGDEDGKGFNKQLLFLQDFTPRPSKCATGSTGCAAGEAVAPHLLTAASQDGTAKCEVWNSLTLVGLTPHTKRI